MATPYNNAPQRKAHHLVVYAKDWRSERQTEETKPLLMGIANWPTKEELDERDRRAKSLFSWMKTI